MINEEVNVLSIMYKIDESKDDIFKFWERSGCRTTINEAIEKIKNKRYGGGARCPLSTMRRKDIFYSEFGKRTECYSDFIDRLPECDTACKHCWNFIFNYLLEKEMKQIDVIKF